MGCCDLEPNAGKIIWTSVICQYRYMIVGQLTNVSHIPSWMGFFYCSLQVSGRFYLSSGVWIIKCVLHRFGGAISQILCSCVVSAECATEAPLICISWWEVALGLWILDVEHACVVDECMYVQFILTSKAEVWDDREHTRPNKFLLHVG